MLFLILLEEIYECDNAFDGHCVIDGCAEAANALVALEVIESGCLGGCNDFCVGFLGCGDKGNVHEGTEFLVNGTAEHP